MRIGEENTELHVVIADVLGADDLVDLEIIGGIKVLRPTLMPMEAAIRGGGNANSQIVTPFLKTEFETEIDALQSAKVNGRGDEPPGTMCATIAIEFVRRAARLVGLGDIPIIRADARKRPTGGQEGFHDIKANGRMMTTVLRRQKPNVSIDTEQLMLLEAPPTTKRFGTTPSKLKPVLDTA